MRFNEGAGIDISEIRDMRGIGGRVAAGGSGLGIVGLIIYFLMSAIGGSGGLGGLEGFGSGGGFGGPGIGGQTDSTSLESECRTGADANTRHDCAIVAIVNSIQDYWTAEFARSGTRYDETTTTFFTGGVDTGCGSASSDVGPFYCPADQGVYIDLGFYDQLRTQFGAQGGLFAEAYVLAHEYGHHVQNLLGTSNRVRGGTGPESDGVRLELQADCYAGVWANSATRTPTESGEPLVAEITQDDIARALDTASRIGDDFIQEHLGGGRVDESKFSHGTSQQREKWFTAGLRSGNPASCDTFNTNDLG